MGGGGGAGCGVAGGGNAGVERFCGGKALVFFFLRAEIDARTWVLWAFIAICVGRNPFGSPDLLGN